MIRRSHSLTHIQRKRTPPLRCLIALLDDILASLEPEPSETWRAFNLSNVPGAASKVFQKSAANRVDPTK
jgi:hypothetical protein